MTSLSRLEIDRSEPFTTFLFFREDSKRAGEAMIRELKAKGKLTKKEMSEFASKLESGVFGFRFSRHNFYARVLKTFMDLGFVGLFPSYEHTKGRTIMAYRAIAQPIPSRRPDNPSFWSVTYQVCKWWNDLMFS